MTARVTTIVPTYRRPAMLRRALESVLSQRRDDVIVRVLDNASGDDTEAVVRVVSDSDHRVVYHCHATNIGGVANFEYGLSKVDTEFFSILSDDDYLLPGFYERALAALDANPDAAFWAGTTLHVDEDERVVEARLDHWTSEGRFEGEEGVMNMTRGRAPTWTGIVFRRTVLERFGLPDRDALGPADFDFVLRAAAHYPFIVEKHPSAVFTLNRSSFSAMQPLSSFWPGWVRIAANIRAWNIWDDATRERIAQAIEFDARRMLFRRGIHAVVAGRMDYAGDASAALRSVKGGSARGLLLDALSCFSRLPGTRALMAAAYGWMETRVILQRGDLQSRYGSLLRKFDR